MGLTATHALLALSTEGPSSDVDPASSETGGVEPSTETQEEYVAPTPVYLQMQLVGGNDEAVGTAIDELPGKTNYLLGSDSEQWYTRISNFEQVRYADVYPGIDVTYLGTQGNLRYDFNIEPQADPSDIQLQFDGARSLQISENGDLVVAIEDGELIQRAPFIYQTINGQEQTVTGGYQIHADQTVSFQVGSYDSNYELVIDPTLSYSTFLGGTGTDQGYDVEVDGAGNIYIAGLTSSSNLIGNSGGKSGGNDAFVIKTNAAGTSISYTTFIGGGGDDRAYSMAIDGNNDIYLAGATTSSDFPRANAFQNSLGGGWDGFVTKLDANGSTLEYSTYLGGSGNENINGLHGYSNNIIALDGDKAWVTGMTASTNITATSAAFQTTNKGGFMDAYAARLGSGGSLDYFSYLGGANDDRAASVAVHNGHAYVTGFTHSDDFPKENAYQATRRGSWDIFVSRINPSPVEGQSSLEYSTFLGGTSDDYGQGIDVNAAGEFVLTGLLGAWGPDRDFPMVNSIQGTPQGIYDGYVTKFNAAGDEILFSTALGGTEDERAQAIAYDSVGNIYVTGFTSSAKGLNTYPAVDAFQPLHGGGHWDGFVTKIAPDGSRIIYSSYFGGSGDDRGQGLAFNAAGDAIVTGLTTSDDFPRTGNAIQDTRAGGWDAFLMRFTDTANHTPQIESIGNQAIEPGETITIKTQATDPDGPVAIGSTEAVEIAEGRIGDQTYNGSLGMDFDVVESISVTHLGVFDDGSDGLKVPLTAYIYNRDTQAELAKADFAIGTDPQTSGELRGGIRYLELGQAVTLVPGNYTVVAENYQRTERNVNFWQGVGELNSGGGHVLYSGSWSVWGQRGLPRPVRKRARESLRRRQFYLRGSVPRRVGVHFGSSSRGSHDRFQDRRDSMDRADIRCVLRTVHRERDRSIQFLLRVGHGQ